MTDGSAMILLTSGGSSFSLGCSSGSVPTDWADRSPRFGDATTTLGAMLADSIGEQEFRVLWVMSREYRSGETADPAPLSYPRVVRALGLSTEKQASSAAARLKRRFADACLMPDQVEPDLQRAWMCRFAVQHHLFDPLIERYGDPPAD